MATGPHILAASVLLVIFCVHSASSETLPLAAVNGYRFPSIFALNDGKPFYLDKDPITGEIHFNPGERKDSTDAVAEESSPVADAATAADEYDEEEEDEKSAPHSAPAAADDSSRRTPPKPLKAAPVVEEIDEDEPPPTQSRPSSLAPIPKDQIDRKDTASNLKTTGGGRPNDIHDGSDNNPFFHQFLNLNVHEYGDRIPGASSIRDDPYSFGNLNAGSSPFEREYKFPLISSSYANTKVQGVGGNYYYGDKGNDKDKNKDKYKPGYTGGYTTSSTKRPAPSYYHESGKDDEDEYYGRPSSTSSASDAEEDEEEDYHKYAGSSHHQGNRDGAEEGADEEEEEEGDESIDELVEEVSDYNRPPAPPKPPVTPSSQPPKETSPSNQQQHHYHHQGDEADDEASEDYDDERPLHSSSGGGYGNRPAADNQRPQTQQTYYYGSPSYEEEEEEEEQNEGPQRKPENFQGAHRGEEDRPRPSQANEEAEEEGGEEEESTVKEKPSSLPPKPSLSYLGFSSDFDGDHHGTFGEKLQGSQNVEKPTKENPGYKYGYNGPPHEFSVDGFFSSDLEGPPSKPAKEPETVDSTSGDKKPQPSNKNEDKDEKQEVEEDNTKNVYDNRRPYNPPQGVRFTQPPPSQPPTQRPTIQQSQQTATPPSNLNQGTYHKPLYQSPYGIEEPFRPIYGPGDDERETYVRPVQSYQHPNKNQQFQYVARPSSNPPVRATPSPDPRPSGGQQYDSYYPLRPLNVNVLPQNKKEVIPESTPKEPITSTYKPYYDSKTKKPIEQASPSWKVDSVNNNGAPPSRPIQEESKETTVQKEQSKPTTNSQDPVSKYPPTLPPPPPPHREVVGIGSVGEPEFLKPTKQPSYGPFRFPDHDYSQQRPILQPQNGQNFIQRPSANNPVTAKPILPPPPFGLPPQSGPQRPILPPSQNIRPQLLDNHPPPPYRPQRPPTLGGGPPLQPPPRRWEERPVHPHSNVHPASQNFPPHRPPPRSQDQPLNGPPSPPNGHPYKFASRKPGQEPVLMGSAPNAVFGNGFNANNKKNPPPNGPKAQAPDPNLPNILPQFRPNAKVSYSTIQREKGPYSPPPPPPPFGPNQRISNGPERRIISPFYDHLQPPPPPNRLHRIQGSEPEIPYGPPQVYPFGPGGSPPVGRRSGQHHLARVGEENVDSGSESLEEIRKRPQVTTLQMMRNGLMEHQSSRHPVVSKEDSAPKSTANPPPIQVNPTIYVTPDEGSTSASLSVDSSASEDHPVFVVYPVSSSDSSFRDDGVVIGTRGSQRPLPPSSISTETAPSVLPQRTNSVLSDFPYPLVKPSEALPTIPTESDSSILGPIYSFVQEEGPDDNRKDNTESNIIPYLQDYSPYATRKPVTAHNLEPTVSTTPEPSSSTTSPPSTTTSTTEKSMAKSPVAIVNAWQPDSEVEVSATMHTGGNPGLPVNHRPLIENKKEPSTPPSLNFQAPFHASENIVPSPDSGWSAVGGSTSTVLPSEGSPTISRVDYNSPSDMNNNDGDSSDTSKFDFDNFKPQLFGGFKPIYSLPGEEEGEFKYALGTTERQER